MTFTPRKVYASFFYSILFLLTSIASVQAAVTTSQDITLKTTKTTGNNDVTLVSGSAFDSVVVGNSGFTFTLSGSQSVTLRDTNRERMSASVSGVADTCGEGYSEIIASASKGTSILITMEGNGCPSGGGGGGSYSAPTTSTETTTTTQTTTTSSPSTSTTNTTSTSATTLTTGTSYVEGAPPPPIGYQPSSPTVVPPSVSVDVAFPAITQISRGLGVGATGEDVRALQEALARMPDIYPEGLATSRFGALTKAAVGRFQMKYNIVVSENDPAYGYVGPKTRAKLMELFGGAGSITTPVVPQVSDMGVVGVFTRALAVGDIGDDVTQLQAFLAKDPALYPEGLVTGRFGSLTKAAVMRFQERYGINPIGRVGPQTMAKLNEVMGGGQNDSNGSTSAPQSVSPTDADQRAALQNQINNMQAMVSSLMLQLQAAQSR